jgi:hypothetical protein
MSEIPGQSGHALRPPTAGLGHEQTWRRTGEKGFEDWRHGLRKTKRNGLADRPIGGLDDFRATGLINKGLIHSAAQQHQVGRQSFWSLRKQDRIELFSWIDHESTAGVTHPPIISDRAVQR